MFVFVNTNVLAIFSFPPSRQYYAKSRYLLTQNVNTYYFYTRVAVFHPVLWRFPVVYREESL